MYGKIQCPDCESYISQSAKNCGGCGWEPYSNRKIVIKDCRCGKQADVNNLCFDCYELARPKSEAEIKAEEWRKKDREQAILEGCVTPEDFANRTKRMLKISRFGKLVLDLVPNEKKINTSDRLDHLQLSVEAIKLRDELDEKQQKKLREMIHYSQNINIENKACEEEYFNTL